MRMAEWVTLPVAGPGKRSLLRAGARANRQRQAAASGQAAGRVAVAEAAYRIVAYTPADATADVVTAWTGASGATTLTVTWIEVIWRRGDWRVVAPPGGDWACAATPISSLAGYTTFPGAR